MAGFRNQRLAAEFQRDIATLLMEGRIKDPRIGDAMITVTEVRFNKDMSQARVLVSIFGEEHPSRVLQGLNSAAPFIQTTLARKIRIRHMPQLVFVPDLSLVEGDQLTELIDGNERLAGQDLPADDSVSD
jgi:ribosome-binding factor A